MIVELNGKNIEIDLLDADVFGNYEKALEPLSKKIHVNTENPAQFIKDYCKVVYNFFDTLLGEGTAQSIFEGKNNIKICNDCLQKCVVACNDYIKNHFNEDVTQLLESWKGII